MTLEMPTQPTTTRRARWAALALAALLAGCAATTDPSPTPSASAARPSPSAAQPTEPPPAPTDQAEPAEFELPAPICPSPPGPVVVPDVLVERAIGDDPGVIAVRGSTTFATCTTTSTTDIAVQPSLPVLTATPEERLILRIADGWSILRVEGFDAPAVGDGGNIQAPIDTPQGADRVEVPVPQREGDARASWTVYVARVDGRAVGMVEVSILVHLATGG